MDTIAQLQHAQPHVLQPSADTQPHMLQQGMSSTKLHCTTATRAATHVHNNACAALTANAHSCNCVLTGATSSTIWCTTANGCSQNIHANPAVHLQALLLAMRELPAPQAKHRAHALLHTCKAITAVQLLS
jgi:hypothetical protein